MNPPPEYKAMGEDGQEYGPVPAAQIRQWIMEQRLDRKSPVLPPGGKDWVFLGSLSEFNELFNPPKPHADRHKQMWLLAAVSVGLGALVIFALIKLTHH
jgi:hypothetical protein